MKRNGDSANKKITTRLSSSSKKKKTRPPEILRSIKSTNKLSVHNSSSRSSVRGMSVIKLKDISLTPRLPKPPGRLHLSSAKKEQNSTNGSQLSTNNTKMRVIHEVIDNPTQDGYGQSKPPLLQDPLLNKRNVQHQHTRSISE